MILADFLEQPESALLPCPLCGGDAEHVGPISQHSGTIEGSYAVRCKECYFSTRTRRTRAGATEMWNTRTPAKRCPVGTRPIFNPCPLCASWYIQLTHAGDWKKPTNGHYWQENGAICMQCGANTIQERQEVPEAVAAWNTRVFLKKGDK